MNLMEGSCVAPCWDLGRGVLSLPQPLAFFLFFFFLCVITSSSCFLWKRKDLESSSEDDYFQSLKAQRSTWRSLEWIFWLKISMVRLISFLIKYLGLPQGGNPNLYHCWLLIVENIMKMMDRWIFFNSFNRFFPILKNYLAGILSPFILFFRKTTWYLATCN